MVLGSWLEDELKKRRQRQINAAVTKAVAEAVPNAVAKAVAEARAEERAETHQQRMEDFQKWQTWNRNREAAQAAGQEFNEPPPSAPSADPENPAI